MEHYSWRHIDIFHAVMTTKSLTDAAQLLHTSQPTVSQELARFEKILGFRVFDRIKGRLHPTEQGLRLFEEVERSYYGLERISRQRRASASFSMPSWQSPVCPPLLSHYCPRSAAHFMRSIRM